MTALLSYLCLVTFSSLVMATEVEQLVDPSISACVAGVVEVPGGVGPYPAVILLHGAAGYDERYPRLARLFADSGFVALALDYYAEAGYSPIGSDEKIEKWPAYQAAVQNAVEYICTLPAVAGRAVGLVGFSRGAFLAVSVASSLEPVKVVVDFFGGGGGGTRSVEQEVQGFPSLLILHGDADRVVPLKYAQELQDAAVAAGGDVEMQIYPGEGHGLSEATMPDALQRTVAFLRKHLVE